jgi:hypothetical protein
MSVINKIVFQIVILKVLLEEEGTTYLIVEALQHKISIPRKHFPSPYSLFDHYLILRGERGR